MKRARTIVALGLLLLASGQAAAQPADSQSLPKATPQSEFTPAPPGIQRLEIKPDTPAERAAFLARRRATLEQQKIEAVTPLPAQRLPPSPPPVPQQR